MVVTQHEIDAAILRAEDAKQKLYLDIETRLKTGCSIDDCDVEMYRNLRNAIFLLENSSQFLVQDCITTREIWEQIIFINQNSFVC